MFAAPGGRPSLADPLPELARPGPHRHAGQPWCLAAPCSPAKVVEANLLARRTAKIFTTQLKAGGFASIENPEGSLLWDTDVYG